MGMAASGNGVGLVSRRFLCGVPRWLPHDKRSANTVLVKPCLGSIAVAFGAAGHDSDGLQLQLGQNGQRPHLIALCPGAAPVVHIGVDGQFGPPTAVPIYCPPTVGLPQFSWL